MKNIKILYFVAGLYNCAIGGMFLIAPAFMFDLLNIGYPNHWGYANFPAAMVLIFAIMFFQLFDNPITNRNLMPYAIMFKIACCTIIFGYSFILHEIPMIWLAFGLVDTIFLGLFISAYTNTREEK